MDAPFPWFGGKSRVAAPVWERFGGVGNYIEPFFGSGAVLLGRPAGAPGIEVANDLDGMVSNFWRATSIDPAAVWGWAGVPVNEVDLHARHAWLTDLLAGGDFAARLMGDPDFYDAKVAGWWVWGLCSWVGSGWCSGSGAWMPDGSGRLVKGGGGGAGVARQLPKVAGGGLARTNGAGLFAALAARLRFVKVLCGDWERAVSPALTVSSSYAYGGVGIFLDPPYAGAPGGLYREDSAGVAGRVLDWCKTWGSDERLRIALCGQAGQADALEAAGWSPYSWARRPGYAGGNPGGEVVWFSPGCLPERSPGLFA